MKGSWELQVAKYLDKNSITWSRDIKPFNYQYKDKWHLYFPDFYLKDYNVYIEVKGYMRDRDIAKWKAVDNLIVIKEKEIKLIQKGIFNLAEYYNL